MIPCTIICGKSGTGKTTIINMLQNGFGLVPAFSYTTRPQRGEDDNSHIFVSFDEIKNIPSTLVSFTFDGYCYCFTKEQIYSADIIGMAPEGVRYLSQYRSHIQRPIKIVEIVAPDTIRLARMIVRGDSPEMIEKRFQTEKIAFKNLHLHVDKVVQNIDLKACLFELTDYLHLVQRDGK